MIKNFWSAVTHDKRRELISKANQFFKHEVTLRQIVNRNIL